MKIILIILILVPWLNLEAQRTGSWGDQGNGKFRNPVLNADYSDPDVIRVGEKYYMICSEFHFMGMTIQESDDMVNWRIVGKVYDRLDFPEYENMKRYRSGSWAPALRHHDGKFWVYFCTPNEGLFMTNAQNPEGPWKPLLNVEHVARWEDPCPFWDDDGQAYLGRSAVGAGPIIIHKMSYDGTRLLDKGDTVYVGPTAEGTKIHKLNGYYYLSIPEGGVRKGYQTMLRSKNLYGPYERRIVLETGSTQINGPHQGAIVDNPNGEWWFYHYQQKEGIGRVMHLQPMWWENDWPVIGQDYDGNGVGEPVAEWDMPNVGKKFPVCAPLTDDEFNSPGLGLQWQWNHNPLDENWSLTKQKGSLLLESSFSEKISLARNTITQKIMGNTGEAYTKMDLSKMVDGQKSGMLCMSNVFDAVGVTKKDGSLFIFYEQNDSVLEISPLNSQTIFLKVEINITDQINRFYYSVDNKKYTPIGNTFRALWANWKGTKIGLFNYHTKSDSGVAAYDYFRYNYDGPNFFK